MVITRKESILGPDDWIPKSGEFEKAFICEGIIACCTITEFNTLFKVPDEKDPVPIEDDDTPDDPIVDPKEPVLKSEFYAEYGYDYTERDRVISGEFELDEEDIFLGGK